MSKLPRQRSEPELGDLDQLDVPSGPNRPPRRRGALHGWLWPALLIVLVAVLALAWVEQDRLRAWLPETRLNATLDQADQALAEGRLLDGASSAQALYTQALAQAPDNNRARDGLHAVGRAELARAASSLRADQLDQAEMQLARASSLLGGGQAVEALRKRLNKARHPASQLEKLIDAAQSAMAAGRVAGPEGAAELYHQALQTDADNQVARHGLNRAGDALASQARIALNDNQPAVAASSIAELDRLLPRHAQLPALRAGLAGIKEARAQAVRQHLQQAQQALREGHITGAGADDALAQFQAVLALDAHNAEAEAGLQQVARALIVQASAAMDVEDFGQARQLLARAASLAPESAELSLAQLRLRTMPGAAAATAHAGSAPGRPASTGQPASTGPVAMSVPAPVGSTTVPGDTVVAGPASTLAPLQQVEVDHLLLRAQGAVKAGHIMLPPGQGAYGLYRQVLDIDPHNAEAQAGLKALVGQAVQDFGKAMADGKLERAAGYLDTLRSLAPADPRIEPLRKQLDEARQAYGREAPAGTP